MSTAIAASGWKYTESCNGVKTSEGYYEEYTRSEVGTVRRDGLRCSTSRVGENVHSDFKRNFSYVSTSFPREFIQSRNYTKAQARFASMYPRK